MAKMYPFLLMTNLVATEFDWAAETKGFTSVIETKAAEGLASADIRDQAWGAHLDKNSHFGIFPLAPKKGDR
jgi:hypothetical protein